MMGPFFTCGLIYFASFRACCLIRKTIPFCACVCVCVCNFELVLTETFYSQTFKARNGGIGATQSSKSRFKPIWPPKVEFWA